jgi:hypothetical protein
MGLAELLDARLKLLAEILERLAAELPLRRPYSLTRERQATRQYRRHGV